MFDYFSYVMTLKLLFNINRHFFHFFHILRRITTFSERHSVFFEVVQNDITSEI